MSLLVEVAGFGICNDTQPHSVLVICVQQENFQAWTVYRRYTQFMLLSDQLRDIYSTIPALPHFDAQDFSTENLEACRLAMNKWIQVAGTWLVTVTVAVAVFQVRSPQVHRPNPSFFTVLLSVCSTTILLPPLKTINHMILCVAPAPAPAHRSFRQPRSTHTGNVPIPVCGSQYASPIPGSTLAPF